MLRFMTTELCAFHASSTEMGELFKVLAIGKGIDGPLQGFQSARHIAL